MDVQTEHSSVGDNHRTAETSQDPHEAIPADLPRLSNFAVVVAALVVVGCFAGLFALGWFPHQRREAELTEHAQEMNELKPVVQVAAPQRTQAGQDLVLPADVRAMQETSIFPRANGYLKKLYVDIGDQVKSGQLLAEIDSPDIDAELAQAKAAQVQSQAQQTKAQDDLELAQATFKRYEAFSKTGGVTQQQFDEKQAALTQAQSVLAAATANVKAADANVQRLAALQGFEKVFAPFSGTITARNYDLGALMTPGGTPGRELFRIADVSTLRVFVNVPQTYVTALRTGQEAFLAVRNYPGKEFTGSITRTAGALDPATRTLSYEIDVPNPQGTLFSGMYATARLQVHDAQPPLVVPTSALVFDSAGTRVWVVQNGKVFPRKVDLGRDFGTQTEVASGLTGNEEIVTNPGERLAEGADVQLASNSQTPPAEQHAALSANQRASH